ncbi:MAG: Holliday junction branch migration protein RuvA [Candidatus Kerfeldbacteria bacterium CG15_BIG_FIL_POST_REV_8_21_14_020_45_12]|uniref:Holliday junction branch migration complex subunit RuvA n=1 Tax=Candidatus Kerfeldbacteria bacterium CG15_BIG_FIL_POST_REV_8_21_14_020_45_12 TaxID=2014247 RepID=A0A2M7H395_9BACT|nr:MAG: Holliday junction branch migration protein RuvA [Candidatus Kerfeldbacteria bacterium CG15_BIG_FIL_POST_REV_8_21_14_020_45_12]PJA93858.1 MAG: Holliday junction branch migration protein RuvA [Candidatus Kerfeldbacteria bacterium CG_4_9_14_3_um_filter_45_8]
MIAYIEGKIQDIDEEGVVVLINGLGYMVSVPERLTEQWQLGQDVSLHTHQHIREDALDLYGFTERSDLLFFRQLIKVSGVGTKLALAVLSQLETPVIKRAIIHGDVSVLTSISGVGKKTAERIVFDLKESIGVDAEIETGGSGEVEAVLTAIDALMSLGYNRAEAVEALQGLDADLSVEEQVRAALKKVAR